jgi:hypothetical protein
MIKIREGLAKHEGLGRHARLSEFSDRGSDFIHCFDCGATWNIYGFWTQLGGDGEDIELLSNGDPPC